MQPNRRLLDDIARLATGTAGLVQGAGREAETLLRHRLERLLDRMDLVPREEFDAVKAMAAQARLENEALAERLAALEAAIQSGDAKAGPKSRAADAGKTAKKPRRASTGKAAKPAKKPRKTAK
ncbi:MAG: accessory factor UbiK family protein [Alphaproteobacteria bacterium]|jgi:BMFP domain-containing protein YqiC|nr:accessory factor UbiK family protein [Alphaproteobacteria bacterium]MDP6814778.1 accessory factor UbiK family protein [Alphaproteobacteria bacterium]